MATEKQPSVKSLIVLFLQEKRQPQYKGRIEDYLRQSTDKHSLGDTTARRLRELVEEERIEKLADNEGNTMYKLKEQVVIPTISTRTASNYRCFKCSKDAVAFLDDKPVCQAHNVKMIEPVMPQITGLF